ncbi:type II toxin-antitoxin system HipA family toxin [Gracilimonas sp. Q87]|uniref:type II toxin-antitoxin system HipA family toxin n=1 Tax=Gracilimonas sp. Q87 TaxID=3384766 RepID=UPI0039844C91
MITTAFVNIWGRTVGAVAWDQSRGLTSFEYDPSFKNSGIDLAPLTMPVDAGRNIFTFPNLRKKENPDLDAFKGLPGLLADSLPDNYGNQLINVWLAQQGRPQDSMNPVEKLCFIGKRGMGALEFEPAQLQGNKQTFNIEVESLVQLASEMLSKKEDFSTQLDKEEGQGIRQILRIGTSAGGARPKAVITYNEKTREVRSGQTKAPEGFDHWLIKLDGVSDVQLGKTQGYGRVEMAYYLMGKDCGIEMMPSRLLEENGRAHFMTKRFDREGAETKHHIQTLCAIKHFDFNDVLSFSYEQLFQTMRELRLTYPEAEQMFRRMVFNVAARNCDDHTKNFSFRLKEGGKWELAPAYDLCHAYRPGSEWVSQHSLSINGKRKEITREDLLTVAKSMNIKKAGVIIDQVNEVVMNWDQYANEAGVDSNLREVIEETLVRLD